MPIKQLEIAEPEKVDPNQTRAESLKNQIDTAKEALDLLSDDQKKSERAFNLRQRIATLKMQLDRLNKRVSDNKEREKKDKENEDKEESGFDDEEHLQVLDQTGFWGAQGAGCLVMARDTKRFLLMLRSADVEQPLTWGTLGGAIDRGESAKEGAIRELREESGYRGKITGLTQLYVFRKDTFKYTNFLILVPKEFKPKVDWENIRGQWFDLNAFPKPLHFGVTALLRDPASVRILQHVVS